MPLEGIVVGHGGKTFNRFRGQRVVGNCTRYQVQKLVCFTCTGVHTFIVVQTGHK